MRVVLYYISLFLLLLLGGGNDIYAGTNHNQNPHTPIRTIQKKHHVKFTNPDQGTTIIEDADLDAEEEHVSGSDVKDGGSNKIFTGKYSLLDGKLLKLSGLLNLSYNSKSFKIFAPVCGHSTPIYIIQRTLRI